MDDTIERLYYSLGDEADTKTIRHIKRYDFMASNAKDNIKRVKDILDFGCGSGYGSRLLKKAFPEANVIGYDVSEEAMKYAIDNNAVNGVIFLTKLQEVLKNKPFDIVILCDMIEHLTDDEQKQILDVLTKHSPKATVYISTPLSNYNGQSQTNKYHINMFTRDRFERLLHNYFGKLELWLLDWSFSRKLHAKEQYGGVVAICQM